MAYTIQVFKGGHEKRDRILVYLRERLIKDGRFRAMLEPGEEKTSRTDRNRIQEARYQHSLPCIRIRLVRLVKKKAYCGNHPGECPVDNKPKPISSHLEWEDWVKFHAIVNRALNRFKTDANVWSLPHDVRGRMWIRKGLQARLHYDWTERFDSYGRAIRDWNPGTEDQFQV